MCGLFCVLIIVGVDVVLCECVVVVVYGNNICIYFSDDLVGVEIGGVVKNILVIVIGVVDGL